MTHVTSIKCLIIKFIFDFKFVLEESAGNQLWSHRHTRSSLQPFTHIAPTNHVPVRYTVVHVVERYQMIFDNLDKLYLTYRVWLKNTPTATKISLFSE